MGRIALYTATALAIVLILTKCASADTYTIDNEETINIISNCNSSADNSTLTIHNSTGALKSGPVNMTNIGNNSYQSSVTFISADTYIATKTCNSAGVPATTKDNIIVRPVISTTFILLLIAGLLAYLFIYRQGYHFLGATTYVVLATIFPFAYNGNISPLIIELPFIFCVIFWVHEANELFFGGKQWFNG